MTEKEIKRAADRFAQWENMCPPKEPGGELYNKHDFEISKKAFIEGANWALKQNKHEP